MNDAVSELIVKLDASQYVAESQRVAAAGDKLVASGEKIVTTNERVTKATRSSEGEFARWQARHDPVIRVQQQLQREMEKSQRLLESGIGSEREHARILGIAARAAEEQIAGIKRAGSATQAFTGQIGLARHELINLSRQMQDVGVSLASGQSPLTVLAQQGTQVADVFATTRGTVGGFVSQVTAGLRSLITPTTVAVAGFAGLAAGVGAILLRADSLAGEARRTSSVIQAMGKDAEITADQVHVLTERMRDLGASKEAARTAIIAAIRTPGASGDVIERSAGLASDFAAAFGGTVEEATKRLIEFGTQGAAAIKKLDDALNFLAPDQAAHVEMLARQGRNAEAAAFAYDVLSSKIAGTAREQMSVLERGILDVERAWSTLLTRLAKSDTTSGALRSLATIMEGLAGGDTAEEQLAILERRAAFMRETWGDALTKSRDELTLLERMNTVLWAQRGIYGDLLERIEKMRNPNMSRIPGGVQLLLPGAPGAVGVNPYAAATAADFGPTVNPDSQRQTKAVDEIERAIGRETKALGAQINMRERLRAEMMAEDEAVRLRLDTDERARLIRLRVGQAITSQATAARDNVEAIVLESRGVIAIADAYAKGEAQGRAMEATVRAQSEAHRNAAVNVTEAATAYGRLAAAQDLLGVTRQAESARAATAVSAAMLEAAQDGTYAAQEAQRAAEIGVMRRKAEGIATDDLRTKTLAAVDVLDRETRAKLENNQALDRAGRIRAAEAAAVAAESRARVAAIADPTEQRAAQMQLERQEKLIELRKVYNDLTEDGARAEMAAFDRTQAARSMERYFNEVSTKAREVSRDIADFLVDGFVNAAEGGRSTFDSLWDGALAGGKRFAARLASVFLEQKFLIPITTPIVAPAITMGVMPEGKPE